MVGAGFNIKYPPIYGIELPSPYDVILDEFWHSLHSKNARESHEKLMSGDLGDGVEFSLTFIS